MNFQLPAQSGRPEASAVTFESRTTSGGTARPLRFAVICDANMLEDWHARCLGHLLQLEGVELALVIVDAAQSVGQRPHRKPLSGPFQRISLWDWYYRFYVGKRSSAKRRVRTSDVARDVPILSAHVVEDEKGFLRLHEADIADIRAHNLDFILQFGFGVLDGDVLSAARRGVWIFRHDDDEKRYGRPPFFWELCSSGRRITVALERLMEAPERRVILQSGTVKTVPHSYVQTADSVLYRLIEWPARVCKDLQGGNNDNFEDAPASAVLPTETHPTNMQMLRFALILARRFVSSLVRFLLLEEEWHVGIVHSPIQTFLTPGARPPVQWLPTVGNDRFLADPFVRVQDGDLTLLLEEFDRRTGKGHISAVKATRDGEVSPPVPVLRTASHMAYPFIVEHQGEVYCVPDTSHAGEVALYRATSFPTAWEKVTTLLEDFAGCDSTVFQHGGRWWLLCTGNDSGVDTAASKRHITGVHTTLYAWHAGDLLGPWKPHGANPLKVDISSSRPAGTPFLHEGRLYRPAQDASSTYGGAVVLNCVTKLTPAEFQEEPVTIVKPYADSPYRNGLHTISGADGITVIDGKREIYYPRNLPLKIKQLAIHVLSSRLRPSNPSILMRATDDETASQT